QVVGDDPPFLHAGIEEEPLADRVNGQLKDAREAMALPRVEGKIVVAELEIRRVIVAERFDGIIEPGIPPPVRRGKADRLNSGSAENPMGALEIAVVRLRIAVDIMEMAVRMGVVATEVGKHFG